MIIKATKREREKITIAASTLTIPDLTPQESETAARWLIQVSLEPVIRIFERITEGSIILRRSR